MAGKFYGLIRRLRRGNILVRKTEGFGDPLTVFRVGGKVMRAFTTWLYEQARSGSVSC